ncbi:hypothetical protein QAD02_023340 [Eretmocerus hayati]|uniref:Uncharacterized protein n=1 Tax=Eretmocerus hayati TaxID=131215 RepID=A0ACC2PVI3_9HYME|nr:hypothetical protein QAD02_023340 [Eretmocerus hayati]
MHPNCMRRIVVTLMMLPKLNGSRQILYDIVFKRTLCNVRQKAAKILGIETSCDDTGFAIVDTNGQILGEALNSQLLFHLAIGGINPPNAQFLHAKNIQETYEQCLVSANMTLDDVDAIAVTLEPGLPLSLAVGRDFARKLSLSANKPVIPIHHMQAHALVARIDQKIDFPFLTLLISGGHCVLALAETMDQFKLLGRNTDDPVGEAFDKTARRLSLKNMPEYSQIGGGPALELAARKSDNPYQFEFPVALAHYRDCNFSFSGLKTKAVRHIEQQERLYGIQEGTIIPNYANLCAGFLMAVTKHLCLRLQRAMWFIERRELIPEDKRTLVVSGGVAANNFIANALTKICSENGYRLIRPPPKLCTDNGVMIAWNGVEKYVVNKGVITDENEIRKLDVTHRSPIGEDWCKVVANDCIRTRTIKLEFYDLLS